MEEKDFNALVVKFGETIAKDIRAAQEIAQKEVDAKIATVKEGISSKQEIAAIVAEGVKVANDAVLDILKKQGEEMGELKSQLKASKGGKAQSFEQSFYDAIAAKKAEYDAIVKTGKQSVPFEIEVTNKVAIDMGEDNTIGSGSTQNVLTQNTGIISAIRRRLEKYLAYVSVGSIGTLRALWIEETDPQGNPIFIGEGDAKIQLSTKWIEKTESVKKIGAYGKVTTELMDDLPQLFSYIKNNLMKRLSIKTEDELINGLGTGDTLKGAVTLATAFTAGDNAGMITDANEFDVLTAVALQCEVANGIANAVFIHPATWAKMKGLKDSTGKPIWKDYVETDKTVVIDGLTIVKTTAVAAGDFVGGDMTVLNVLYREQLTIQIGLDGNDFTQNKKTILVESRLVQFASANDTPVLIKGDFETAKAALEFVPVAP